MFVAQTMAFDVHDVFIYRFATQKAQTSGTFLDVVKKNNSMYTHQACDEKFDLGLEWKKSDADFLGGSALFF